MGASALLMLRASSGDDTRVLVGSSAMAEAEVNKMMPKRATRVVKDFMMMVESGSKEKMEMLRKDDAIRR